MNPEEVVNAKFNYPEWDYKHSIKFEPDGEKYKICVKGKLFYNFVDEKNRETWFSILSLDRSTIYDLFWNVCEKLDLAERQDAFNELYYKGKVE